MPITITAADYVGTPPATGIQCPVDDEKVKAADLQVIAAAVLANGLGSGFVVPYSTHFDASTTPFVVGPPNTFSGSTWTTSLVTQDVPDAKVDDDLRITVWGTVQLNATSSPGDVIGELRLIVQEDALNGTPPAPVVVPGMAVVTDNSGDLAVPANMQYQLHARHRVTAAGKCVVKLQVRSEDVTGGAGTATLILLFSARIDVDHSKRS